MIDSNILTSIFSTEKEANPLKKGKPKEQMRLIVYGSANTGKSFLVRSILDTLKDKALVVAPNGMAASEVGGVTIEDAFNIPKTSNWNFRVSKEERRWLEHDGPLSKIDYLLIDNFNMVGSRMLHHIDERCRIAKTADKDKNHLYFGGMNVILFTDFAQLSPDNDSPVWLQPQSEEKDPLGFTESGYLVYRSFKTVIFLEKVMNCKDHRFVEVLENIRNGIALKEDFDYIKDNSL